MSITKKASLLVCTLALTVGLAGCGAGNSAMPRSGNDNGDSASASASTKRLARSNYKSGTKAYRNVNGGHSTLNAHSWKYDHAIYHDLDNLNRTGTNTGYLDKKNVANDSLRQAQTIKPTGYHQKFINREAIVNRGHEIAYSLSKGISQSGKYDPKAESGDQNNMKNLFTQSAFSNQELQTIYESKVRNALRKGEHVIYQVTPVFHGNDLMAKGVHMQAKSTDGKLNFNVYLYNVQPGIKFDYKTGRSTIDRSMKVPTPANAPHFHDNDQDPNATYRNHNRYHTRGYYGYPRHHHFIRHAAEGYAAYRIGKHFGRRHAERRYYRSYRPTMHRHFFSMHRHFGHHRL